eukprot:4087938-Pleurochrysis_carterae.AAC.1
MHGVAHAQVADDDAAAAAGGDARQGGGAAHRLEGAHPPAVRLCKSSCMPKSARGQARTRLRSSSFHPIILFFAGLLVHSSACMAVLRPACSARLRRSPLPSPSREGDAPPLSSRARRCAGRPARGEQRVLGAAQPGGALRGHARRADQRALRPF